MGGDFGPPCLSGEVSRRGGQAIKGRFILSINDVPEIRDTFAGFQFREVKTTYTIGAANDRRPERAELLISNFALGD